jgi:hypothetical protein
MKPEFFIELEMGEKGNKKRATGLSTPVAQKF